MELFQENQALKDLIERLHMELEEAVKRRGRFQRLKGAIGREASSAGSRRLRS